MISAEQADNLMGESVSDLVDMMCTMSGYIDDLEEITKWENEDSANRN